MEERESFYRFSALLLDVGARILREVFTFHHLGSNTLVAYLSLNKIHLLQLPVNVLRQEQRDTLFPPSGNSALIEDFDITLLCLLFRNLDSNKPSNDPVWSKPVKTDNSFQADVGRIRVIRNTLFGHVSSASLDNAAFNTETSNLTTIYKRLISPIPDTQFIPNDLQQMIEKELKGPLQPDLENEIQKKRGKLEEWQRYDEDVKQAVSEIKADIHTIKAGVQEMLDVHRANTRKQEEWSDAISKTEEESIKVKKQWDSLSKEETNFIDKKKQQRIIDLSQMVLEQHRSHAEKNFVETKRYRDANTRLRQHRRLIIAGKSPISS